VSYEDGPDAWRDEYPEVEEAVDAACNELAETSPTTLAGAAALLAFYVEDEPWKVGDRAWHEPAMRNLADALSPPRCCEGRACAMRSGFGLSTDGGPRREIR
jgi:hypothetical protein